MQHKDSSELSLGIDQSNLDHRSSEKMKWNGKYATEDKRAGCNIDYVFVDSCIQI